MSSSQEIERRHPLAKCEECPLALDDKTKYVPSKLPQGAKVAFVGEAPGRTEAMQGEPFVGPSGKLLDIIMQRNKIRREDVVLTNSVCCNKPSGDITPTAAAIKACRPRLAEEVREVDTIVPMGNSAAEAVLGRSTKITQERVGLPKRSDLFPGKRIIPTIHPAACLRFSDHFPYILKDVGKINQADVSDWEPPKYKVWDTPREVFEGIPLLMDMLERGSWLAVDIETGVEKDDVFTHPTDLLCIGISWERGKAIVIGEEALKNVGVRYAVQKLLRYVRIICHNGKFDIQTLQNLGFDLGLRPLAFDTMLASYTLDERKGTNSLDYNGQEILGTPDWKGVIHKYIGRNDSYAKVPRDVLYKYNAYDVAVTFELAMEQLEVLVPGSELRAVHDRMVRTSDMLMEVERDGVRVDMDHNANLTESYAEVLNPLEEKLKPWVDNPRSWLQVRVAILKMLGRYDAKVSDRENADKIGSDEEAITRFRDYAIGTKNTELAQFCKLLLEYRREQKLYSTYVKGIRKRTINGRVYPTYLLHGTTSGRSSCRNPNLQNIVREPLIRAQFAPEEGNVFVQGDYAGAELRVVAVESGDVHLLENLDDWNRMVARQLYGNDYTPEEYVRGKAMVHGTNYGREAYSIAVEYDMDESVAEEYQREYLAMIPGVVAWQEEIKRQVLSGKPLVTFFGRRRRFWLITRDNMKDSIKEGLSFKPQSTASDINFEAMTYLRREFKDRWGSAVRLRIPVHDSILSECPEPLRDEVGQLVRDTMMEAARTYTTKVPFKVDLEWGYNWGDKHELEI